MPFSDIECSMAAILRHSPLASLSGANVKSDHPKAAVALMLNSSANYKTKFLICRSILQFSWSKI